MTDVILEEFTIADFETFKSWITEERMLAQFAGPIFSFPIQDSELVAYLNRPEINPFKVVLRSIKKSIGHCELNFGHQVPRLSRILVGEKSMRGKGFGEQIVREMTRKLFQDSSVKVVDLNVFDFNSAAIRCYEKVGFSINPITTEPLRFEGETWTRLNMILTRRHFSQ
tara:strand:- start:143207 stop:143713 length:507 start_codon:yes stop_codon:yes gene_type:complete